MAAPDFGKIPPFRGCRIERFSFITGVLKKGARADDLLQRLAEKADAFPFLYAHDRNRILMGFVEPWPRWLTFPRSSPIEELSELIEKVEMGFQPISTLVQVISHRYAELLWGSHVATTGVVPVECLQPATPTRGWF
jgi:hypothetical protein